MCTMGILAGAHTQESRADRKLHVLTSRNWFFWVHRLKTERRRASREKAKKVLKVLVSGFVLSCEQRKLGHFTACKEFTCLRKCF